MIFNNGMSLFHGSYTSVEVISLDKCTRGKDFGKLMPEHLVDQYCFLTDRAIGCLDFQEARKYEV